MKHLSHPLPWLLPLAAFVQTTFAADYLTVTEAQKVLFPEAERFEKKAIELTNEQLDQIKEQSGVRQRAVKPEIYLAYVKKEIVGWMMVDSVIGKHEFITYAAALSPGGKVLGVEILSYRESHGGEVRRPEWRAKFKGKTLADPFKLEEDVPNISGATLSCRNILDGVKRLLVLQKIVGA